MLQPHRFRPRARPRGVEDQRVVGRAGAVARERAARAARRRRGIRHRRSSPAGCRRQASRQGAGRAIRRDFGDCGEKSWPPKRSIAISAETSRIGEQIGQLGRFRPGAERHRHGAERGGAETGFEPFQPIIDEDADPLAAADAVRLERGRDAAGAVGEVAIAGRSARRRSPRCAPGIARPARTQARTAYG